MKDTACFYMGKADSSVVVKACESLGIHCSRAYDELHPTQKHYAYIISLARDPVARNISAFFDATHRELRSMPTLPTVEELTTRFLDHWPYGNHMRPLIWFQACFERELGLDVFSQPFSKRKGWAIYGDERRVLVIRTDYLVKKLGKALSELYDLPEDQWPVVTSAGVLGSCGIKKYGHDIGEYYSTFLQEVRLPADYLQKMYDSDYAKHFFFKAELERFRQRWSGES